MGSGKYAEVPNPEITEFMHPLNGFFSPMKFFLHILISLLPLGHLLSLPEGTEVLQGCSVVTRDDRIFVIGGTRRSPPGFQFWFGNDAGWSIRQVRIYDLRRPGMPVMPPVEVDEASADPLAHHTIPPLEARMFGEAPMQKRRWCGAATVVRLAC